MLYTTLQNNLLHSLASSSAPSSNSFDDASPTESYYVLVRCQE